MVPAGPLGHGREWRQLRRLRVGRAVGNPVGLATAACRRGSGEDCEQVRGEVRRQVRGLWGGKDRGQIVGCGVGRTAGPSAAVSDRGQAVL